jgi:hypothetical protein
MPLSATTQLRRHYDLEVASWRTVCDTCQVPLRRQRTSTRYPIGLLLGQPRVRLVQELCPTCRRIYRAEAYPELVPPHGNYAFDLIVQVGLARFLQHRQNCEIQQELDVRWGLRLSCSTISELAQTFLDYLAATHQAHIRELRECLHNDGGYALHVDGTCEAGTEIVFNAIAGNRGWTLSGCKMATEDTTQIQGLLRRCMEWFGPPLALVRDLSAQIEAARQQVMPDIPDLVCHYHFLENVGTRLCEKHHAKLIACLRRLKVRPALCSLRHDLVRHAKQKGSLTPAQIEQVLEAPEQAANLDPAQKRRSLAYLVLFWLEDYGADLRGEYFPFDVPSLALYRRYRTVHGWLLRTMAAIDSPNRAFPTLETIRHHLATVVEDKELVAAAERLEKATTLFNELRYVLRLGGDGHHPLLHQRPVADRPALARQREEHLQKWIDQLNQRRASESDADRTADFTIVLDYLQKYHGKLTGHVIALDDRPAPFVVQRTNNVSEHRFGRTKQGLRRKLGTKNLTRYVQAMRPEELLVANLLDPDYLQIICGGSLENLAASFARNWQAGQTIRSQRRAKTTSHPIPARKRLLREDGFLSKLQQAIATVIKNNNRRGVAA